MTEAEWLASADPEPMLAFLEGKAIDRKLRLFVVACCRRVWHGLRDDRSRAAVETAELFADGNASVEDLSTAYEAAYLAVDECLEHSVFSEDQAIAAYLAAATKLREERASYDPFPSDVALHSIQYSIDGLHIDREREQAAFLRDIFGNPFRPVAFDPVWRTEAAVGIARGIYEDRAFERMPILADALQDAGCEHDDILSHCREPAEHVRGCWVVDLVLAKE